MQKLESKAIEEEKKFIIANIKTIESNLVSFSGLIFLSSLINNDLPIIFAGIMMAGLLGELYLDINFKDKALADIKQKSSNILIPLNIRMPEDIEKLNGFYTKNIIFKGLYGLMYTGLCFTLYLDLGIAPPIVFAIVCSVLLESYDNLNRENNLYTGGITREDWQVFAERIDDLSRGKRRK